MESVDVRQPKSLSQSDLYYPATYTLFFPSGFQTGLDLGKLVHVRMWQKESRHIIVHI